jgi:hypothetical protein
MLYPTFKNTPVVTFQIQCCNKWITSLHGSACLQMANENSSDVQDTYKYT